MESCVDELAYALGMDPIALRLANDFTNDPLTKQPM
jgi:xanthine dehydrogenase YagR molybdenum-binding subunit